MPLLQRQPTRDLDELRKILQQEENEDLKKNSDKVQEELTINDAPIDSQEDSQRIPDHHPPEPFAIHSEECPIQISNGVEKAGQLYNNKATKGNRGSRNSTIREAKKLKKKASSSTNVKANPQSHNNKIPIKCSSSDSVSSIDFDDIEGEGDVSVSHPHHLSLPQRNDDQPSSSHPSSTRSRLKKRPHMAAPKLISNEERLAKKYNELTTLLCRDVVKETAQICHESLRESRILLQNTLAANRLVSHTLLENATPNSHDRRNPDVQFIGWTTAEGGITPHQAPKKQQRSKRKSPAKCRGEEDSSHTSWTLSLATPPRERSTSTSRKDNLMGKSFPSPTPRNVPKSFSKGHHWSENEHNSMEDDLSRHINKEEQRRRQHSDNHLSNTDSSFVRKWLKRKNRQIRQQKRDKRENERFERELDMELEKIRAKRQDMAKEAFQEWSQRKLLELKTRPPRTRDVSVDAKSDWKSKHDEEIEVENGEESPRKSPYHHTRPIHNYVFHRPMSSTISKNESTNQNKLSTKMQIAGKKMATSSDVAALDISQVEGKNDRTDALRLSYDDWLRKKRAQSARERSLSKTRENESAKDAETEEDVKWNDTVKKLARDRRESRERDKKRVDSGLGKKTETSEKPNVLSPELAVTEAPSTFHLPSNRPKSAKYRRRKPLAEHVVLQKNKQVQINPNDGENREETSSIHYVS